MKEISTKNNIMKAAMRLFSRQGYDKVSMRDIAREVGIRASSIYNHFPSKRDILKGIDMFCSEQQKLYAPSLETLLKSAETEHPHKVLMDMIYHYPPEIQEIMDYALMIAAKGINGHEDKESERFIHAYLFDNAMGLIVPLLSRMIELGRIEPLDVKSFAYMATYFALGAAVLNLTDMKVDWETYTSSMSMLFSLVKPVENNNTVSSCQADEAKKV